jgi:hypothetical protein
MTADGVDTFIEVGPGKVLTNLVRRIAPNANAIALDDVLAGHGLDLPILVPTGPGPSDQPADADGPAGSRQPDDLTQLT